MSKNRNKNEFNMGKNINQDNIEVENLSNKEDTNVLPDSNKDTDSKDLLKIPQKLQRRK